MGVRAPSSMERIGRSGKLSWGVGSVPSYGWCVPMESQSEGMHSEHRQFRPYVVRRRTGRNHLRVRASIERIRCFTFWSTSCQFSWSGSLVGHEMNTVISGTFNLGMGEKFDKSSGRALAAGSLAFMPSGMKHFAWTTGDIVIQLHSAGPWKINYINTADDPRNKK